MVRLFDREPRRLRTGRWFRRLGRVLAKVNPWRIQISGRENLNANQVYVIVSNHQSLADIPVIAHLKVDTKWLAKAELFQLPVVGWMLRMAGDVPIERSDRRSSAKALLQCARYLRRHCSVVFFPEGTRSPDGQVLPFNEGPFQLAIREQVQILPLVVEGSAEEFVDLRKDSEYLSSDPRGRIRRRLEHKTKCGTARCSSTKNRGRVVSAARCSSIILTHCISRLT
jgi:1-acyl-sn-glycerol-3-phosphate acyltransferase